MVEEENFWRRLEQTGLFRKNLPVQKTIFTPDNDFLQAHPGMQRFVGAQAGPSSHDPYSFSLQWSETEEEIIYNCEAYSVGERLLKPEEIETELEKLREQQPYSNLFVGPAYTTSFESSDDQGNEFKEPNFYPEFLGVWNLVKRKPLTS